MSEEEGISIFGTGDMRVTEYQARFLTLESFLPGSFFSKREWMTQFVLSFKIHIRSVGATFLCMTQQR